LRELDDPERALSHSADYLDMLSTVVIAWQWLQMATAAQRALTDATSSERDQAFYRGKLQTAAYFFATDLPRVFQLADLCQQCERSYLDMHHDWF
jgi:butyryl-CoA dehydrogenase